MSKPVITYLLISFPQIFSSVSSEPQQLVVSGNSHQIMFHLPIPTFLKNKKKKSKMALYACKEFDYWKKLFEKAKTRKTENLNCLESILQKYYPEIGTYDEDDLITESLSIEGLRTLLTLFLGSGLMSLERKQNRILQSTKNKTLSNCIHHQILHAS